MGEQENDALSGTEQTTIYKVRERRTVQLIVPKTLKAQLIHPHHDNNTNAYRSPAQTFEAVKNLCTRQERSANLAPTKALCNHPISAWVNWSLDFLERLVETPEGYEDALIAVESTTTFVMAEPVNDLTAETVAEFLYIRVFMIFAIAKIVHSDNGAALRSKLVELMAAKKGNAENTQSPTSLPRQPICQE